METITVYFQIKSVVSEIYKQYLMLCNLALCLFIKKKSGYECKEEIFQLYHPMQKIFQFYHPMQIFLDKIYTCMCGFGECLLNIS